jgi:hypothetical protein
VPNPIYVDPSIIAPVVQLDGVCYYRVGPSSTPPQVFSVEATFSNCAQCPGGGSSSSGASSSSGSSIIPNNCVDCSSCPSTISVNTDGFTRTDGLDLTGFNGTQTYYPVGACSWEFEVNVGPPTFGSLMCAVVDGQRCFNFNLNTTFAETLYPDGYYATVTPTYFCGTCPYGTLSLKVFSSDGTFYDSATVTVG